MRWLLPIAFLICPMANAQEWPALRITVNADGLYGIRFADLEPHGDPTKMLVHRIGLFRDGKEQPIEVSGGGDGAFNPGDLILFWGEQSREPRIGPGTYILRYSMSPKRLRRIQGPDIGTKARGDAWRRITLERDRVLIRRPTVNRRLLKRKDRHPWAMQVLPHQQHGENSATFMFSFDPAPMPDAPAYLEIALEGPIVECQQRLAVNLNGTDLEPQEWKTPLQKRVRFPVPNGVISSKNVIQVTNASPAPIYTEPDNELATQRANFVAIKSIAIETPSMLLDPQHTSGAVIYDLLPPVGTHRAWQFQWLSREPTFLYGVDDHVLYKTGLVPAKAEGRQRFAFAAQDALASPASIDVVRKTDLHRQRDGADYLIITTDEFASTLKPLLEWRTSQGLSCAAVPVRELFDTFTEGRASPDAIKLFLSFAQRTWKTRPRYVLIVGDADYDVGDISKNATIPTCLVSTAYNGLSGSDGPYADVDGDGFPELSIGRLPMRTTEEVSGYIKRLKAFESSPPPGPWKRDLKFIASTARFGPAIDAALELAFKKIIQNDLPEACSLGLTYANPSSPFYWPGRDFQEHVISAFNDGCLALTYTGHGSPRRLDRVYEGDSSFPIFEPESLSRINCNSKLGVCTILACWTGQYDHPAIDCLGEELLRLENGPIAVIASSRISHPYPNTLLGKGLARAVFAAESQRVGDVITDARRNMIRDNKGIFAAMAGPFLSDAVTGDQLVADHLALYNLLGDPAALLPIPSNNLKLSVTGEARAGETLAVSITSPEVSGTLHVTLEHPIGRAGSGVSAQEGRSSSLIRQHHAQANNLLVAQSTEVEISANTPVDVTMTIPQNVRAGRHIIKAYVTGSDGHDALGSMRVRVVQ